MTVSRPKSLDDVSKGDYLFHIPTGDVIQLVAIDAEFNHDDARYDGTVTMTVANTDDDTFQEDADTVDMDLHDGDLQPISDRLLYDPDGVLLEFAQQEIGNYVSRLGNLHDFHGIDGVRTIADLRAAAFLYTNDGVRPRLTDEGYASFLKWLMVTDSWPLGDAEETLVKYRLNQESKARGYDDWVDAYHNMNNTDV